MNSLLNNLDITHTFTTLQTNRRTADSDIILNRPSELNIKWVVTNPSGSTRYAPYNLRPRDRQDFRLPIGFREHRQKLPAGWKHLVTPEGATYYHEETRNIVTSDNVGDCKICNAMEKVYAAFLKLIEDHAVIMPDSWELFLQTHLHNDYVECHYYLVSHNNRTLFWLHEARACDLNMSPTYDLQEMESVTQPEYWNHLEFFCMHRPISDGVIQEAIGAVSQGCIDEMTSPGSTSSWSSKESVRFLHVLRAILLCDSGASGGYRTWVVARIWALISRNRHINRHGLEFARLDRSQAVVLRDEDPAPTCIERLLEIFLLGLCERTSKRLDNVWINRVVYQRYWVSFLKALHHEWAIAGAGGVILACANAGLFASGDMEGLAGLFTVASSLCALGGTCTSLVLRRFHSDEEFKEASQASSYLLKAESKYSIRMLSAVLTLPYALVAWSVIHFAIALTAQALYHMESVLARIIVLGLAAVLLASVINTHRFFLESSEDHCGAAVEAWLRNTLFARLFSNSSYSRVGYEEVSRIC